MCSSLAPARGDAGENLGKGPMTKSGFSTAAASPSQRYFENTGDHLGSVAGAEPVCLYLETTNRCNLLCTTCPRTFEDLDPPAAMTWGLFTSIVDHFPKIPRVALHGAADPMMSRALPPLIRYLRDRGAYVLLDTTGTLLTR